MGRTKELMCDVRIVTYNTCKGKVGNVTFHDSLGQLICDDGGRIRLLHSSKHPNRLYFVKWTDTDVKDSVKLSHNKLQFSKGTMVDICSDFIGEYQLQCDDGVGSDYKGLYYVNKEKVSQPGYRGGNSKVPHPNYTCGKRIAIPKQRKIEIPVIKKAEVNTVEKEESKKVETIDVMAIKELLDVLDTYDVNETVYKAGHTLIHTIRGMLK